MKKYSILLLALFWSVNVLAEKHALIIAIGNYPARTGWPTISSLNDVPLIKNALEAQDFKSENILVITDKAATRKGIFNAFKQLMKKVKSGDIVVIHYSGHGQQIFDDNGDEVDGKDETIVPYDALVRYTSNYKGENHIRDDELGKVISDFRNNLGARGQLLLLLDSCHSGTASRGGKARGGKPALLPPNWTSQSVDRIENFNISEEIKVATDASPFVIISGASADELNYEADGVGSLSYAFSRAMSSLGTNDTYRILFSSIASTINSISPRQTPTIEGDVDYVLFQGDYVEQQPYYELLKIARPDIVRLKGGKLNNLFKGTLVSVATSGTTAMSKDDIINTGTIINASYNEATIKLKQPLTNANHKDYWIFIDQPAYEDLSI
ncbi:MAG: caspase family protein, partial [Winogradskyella sp.]|nr:caspase family protein [Winogradskyella sp.]